MTRWNGAAAFMPARLDKPLCLIGAVKTAEAVTGGRTSLQSLLRMSHARRSLGQTSSGIARAARGHEANAVEAIRRP